MQLVEDHGNIRTEGPLDLHRLLRGQKVGRAVEVGLEERPLFGDLSHGPQAEDLVASAVGQDGPVPVDEPVESAKTADRLVARPQVEMVRVGQKALGPHLDQFLGGEGFDRAEGSHREEDGCEDRPVIGVDPARPGPGGRVPAQDFKFKCHGNTRNRNEPNALASRVSPEGRSGLGCLARNAALICCRGSSLTALSSPGHGPRAEVNVISPG